MNGRSSHRHEDPGLLLAEDLETLPLFMALTSWALLARCDSTSRKRLMILGTMAIMGPVVGRWNFPVAVSIAVAGGLPLLVLTYDLW